MIFVVQVNMPWDSINSYVSMIRNSLHVEDTWMLLMIVKIQASPLRMSGDMNLYNHEQHMVSLLLGRLHSYTHDTQPGISNNNILYDQR